LEDGRPLCTDACREGSVLLVASRQHQSVFQSDRSTYTEVGIWRIAFACGINSHPEQLLVVVVQFFGLTYLDGRLQSNFFHNIYSFLLQK
jgi:hypothetical protein